MTPRDASVSSRGLGAREVAGFRVLRSLARDDAAEVFLGHRPREMDEVSGASSVASTVAMKVCPATQEGWRAVIQECAALQRARGDHVVELVDVDADDTSITRVFERLPRGDLAELLGVRDRLDAGEAVTVLAPVAVTLLRLHAAGVAHGAVTVRTVLFRDDGSPVLIGFSGSELFEAGAPEIVLEGVDAVVRDREGVRSLAIAVLGRVTGSRAQAARTLLGDIQACEAEFVLPLLASRLFETAAAVPLRFLADQPEPDAGSGATRVVPLREAVEETEPTTSRARGLLGALVPEPLVQRVLDTVARSPATPVVAASARAIAARWRAWSPRRRRLVLALSAAALTVAVVTATGPASGASSGPENARPMATAPSGGSSAPDHQDPAVGAEDPVPAAVTLLRARDHCLAALSVVCLDGVDETGSSALEDDRAAIRAAQNGAELPDPSSSTADSAAPVLIQRLGDSALIGPESPTSGAVSILLVKGEAGWRIRDVIAAKNEVG